MKPLTHTLIVLSHRCGGHGARLGLRTPRPPQTNWWFQPGAEAGPPRTVRAAQQRRRKRLTPASIVPFWHIADILKSRITGTGALEREGDSDARLLRP